MRQVANLGTASFEIDRVDLVIEDIGNPQSVAVPARSFKKYEVFRESMSRTLMHVPPPRSGRLCASTRTQG